MDMTEDMIEVAGKCFSGWNNIIAICHHNSKLTHACPVFFFFVLVMAAEVEVRTTIDIETDWL